MIKKYLRSDGGEFKVLEKLLDEVEVGNGQECGICFDNITLPLKLPRCEGNGCFGCRKCFLEYFDACEESGDDVSSHSISDTARIAFLTVQIASMSNL